MTTAAGATVAASEASAAFQMETEAIPTWPIVVGAFAAVVFAGSGWWRLRRIPIRPWRFGPGAGLVTFILAIVAGAVSSSIAMMVMGVELNEQSPLSEILPIMLVGWFAQLGVAACLPMIRSVVDPPMTFRDYRMPRRGSSCPDRRKPRWVASIAGLFGLLFFWPMTLAAAGLAGLLWQFFTTEPPSVIAHTFLGQLADAGPSAASVSTIVAVIILPAVVEETLYRGLLQESLRRAKLFSSGAPWQSIILASLLFTAMHIGAVDPHGLAGLFVLSLGFGWVYAKTGRLTASITMHMAFNAGNILLAVPWL
ncbi:MAG: CPBP family intramembrane metalloprotease [Phycisphaerales bacterium]|nr:CPBP family intramembrane metalloprotease [Phycisphaerales bacterium]